MKEEAVGCSSFFFLPGILRGVRAMHTIDIEGYSPDEILGLSDDHIVPLVFNNGPIVFRAGSSQILGDVRINDDILTIELAHIDGGGEGVLPVLGALALRYARMKALKQVEWIVHAVNCARPNLTLRTLLERRGFVMMKIEGIGDVYRHVDDVIV
jgi:hypothetical protein